MRAKGDDFRAPIAAIDASGSVPVLTSEDVRANRGASTALHRGLAGSPYSELPCLQGFGP